MQEGGVWLVSQIFHNDLKLVNFFIMNEKWPKLLGLWVIPPSHKHLFRRGWELMGVLIHPEADTAVILCCNRRSYCKAVAGATFFYPNSGCSAVAGAPLGLVQQQLVQGAGAPAGLQRAEKLGTASQGSTRVWFAARTDSLLPSALRLYFRDKNLASLLPPRRFILEL